MAPLLGKRKRNVLIDKPTEASKQQLANGESDEDVQAIFRRHFEAQFRPLSVEQVAGKSDNEPYDETADYLAERGDTESDNSSWDGFSSKEADDIVEVVEHDTRHHLEANHSKRDLRAYMVRN
jgi:hypothetical protein